MVKGTPQAFAARARISSAPARPALMPPVGAMARGIFASLPKRLYCGVDFRDIHQHLRQQPHPLEGGAVVAQGGLVLGAAVEEIEDGARQPAFRQPAQVLDIDRLPQVHNCELLYLRKASPCRACSLLPPPCSSRSHAAAQTFPSKPIRLICPFPPAGAVDIASRATANELTKILGQTGHRRQQARRRRQPRRRGGGALGARRLHPVHEHQRHPGDQPGAVRQDAVRPEQGPGARSRRWCRSTTCWCCIPRCRRTA